jgi:Icc protein
MKIVHISDIHINAEPILGHDPVARFERCLAHVEEYQSDADRVIVTGDLTHDGRPKNYERLKRILARSSLTGDQSPRLLIGNHDIRENFLAAFPDAPRDGNGFVQWAEATSAGLFIYLDTVLPGEHAGSYCAERRRWLAAVLEKAAAVEKPAWLFMHHNPTSVHVANADKIGIREDAELKPLLAQHRRTIRHMFFGHCHYTLSGSVAGIPFSAPRSTNHVCWPEFSGNPYRMGHGPMQPNYNVCFLGEHDTVIHSVDFLEQDKIVWEETDETGWVVQPA